MTKRRIRRNKHKLLIDTTFILPTLGIDIEPHAMKAYRLMGFFDVYYSEISLVEAFWSILRKVEPSAKNIRRLLEGLGAITRTYNLVIIGPKDYILAYEIYRKGHRDYIDTLLYAIAYNNRLLLLTIDKEFTRFLEEKGYETDLIVFPDDLESLLQG